jgi:hypothetical protein
MIEALFATQQSWAAPGIDAKDKLFSIASLEGSLSKDEFNRCLADRDLFVRSWQTAITDMRRSKWMKPPLSLSVWRTAAMGLAGCTLFLWPLLALALARPDATLGEMVSDGGLCY